MTRPTHLLPFLPPPLPLSDPRGDPTRRPQLPLATLPRPRVLHLRHTGNVRQEGFIQRRGRQLG